MSAKAAVTTFTKSRVGSSIMPGTSFTVMASGDPLYFGSNGEIDCHFDSTRQVMDMGGEGNPIQIGGLNMAKDRIHLQERFTKAPCAAGDATSSTGSTAAPANKDWELLGTNAVTGDVTLDADGGIKVASHGANGDSTIITPHLTSGLSGWATTTWGTDDSTFFRAAIRSGPNITATINWIGLKLTNTDVKATDADQVYFRYQDTINSGKLEFVYSIGSTLTSVDCSVLLGSAATWAISTDYMLAIIIDSTRVARGYVNGILVGTTGVLTNTVDLIPYLGIKSGASSSKSFKVRHVEMGRIPA